MALVKQMSVLLCGLVLCAGLSQAQDKPEKKPVPTHPGLEKLKQLAGEWVSDDESTEAKAEKKDAEKVEVVYKVTAAGSAVAETLLPGTPHEMITMYYVDGGDLVLVHYCAAGNQPRMKAEKSADPNKLVFKFAGGSNIDPAKDMHMHDLTMTFVDADHIRAEWTSYQDGKAQEPTVFKFKRKK